MYQPRGKSYDVIVVGAGHAGCEAALACARLGLQVLVLTINLDNVALMPCNPSVGGPAKANLVREIDALGGEMGRNADATLMQIRMLNTRKGPAVQALRAQTDRKLYQRRMKKVLETTPGLFLKEGIVDELLMEGARVRGVILRDGSVVTARAVVLTTGTYLRAEIFMGDLHYSSGPQGQHAAGKLGEFLMGILPLRRFKTGTPPRVNLNSLDYSKMMIQPGSEGSYGFSFETKKVEIEQVPCWLTMTNERTHRIIQENLHRSAMYSGAITGVGPRYCPSIESKIVLFPDRQGHQVFVEPEGWETSEGYLSGLSTSLPSEIQYEMLTTIPGLENVEMMRPGYAIEYDCLDPTCLRPSLRVKDIEGLFTAGQLNGSSGYEEAAAQGLIAGINAARYCREESEFIIDRSQAFIGVLIDDLVTKGTNEPYRMMTSRAEYRLWLRQDNADYRLTPIGYDLGLITDERYASFEEKWKAIEAEVERLEEYQLRGTEEINAALVEMETSPIRHGISLAELLRRPEVKYSDLRKVAEMPELSEEITSEVEITVKYQGYLAKQDRAIREFQRMEQRILPQIDYDQVTGLSREAREKLKKIQPHSLGQAARISGVSPADISVLLIHLEKQDGGQ